MKRKLIRNVIIDFLFLSATSTGAILIPDGFIKFILALVSIIPLMMLIADAGFLKRYLSNQSPYLNNGKRKV